MRSYGKILISITNTYQSPVSPSSPLLHRNSSLVQRAPLSRTDGYASTHQHSSKTYTNTESLTGRYPPNHLRHRRRPSRRPLPCKIPRKARPTYNLPLQPNMGKPQPNLHKRPPPHQAIPLLLGKDKDARLRRPALHLEVRRAREYNTATCLRTQPHGRRPL